MRTTAILASDVRLASWSRLAARLPDFVTLMKPRVMLLAVFTAVVGIVISPAHLDPLLGSIAILGIAAGAGAAGVLNMWYDADIDAVMARTARRPIPRGRISRAEARRADEFAHAALNACAGIRSIAVPLAYDVHPEFGYLCPAPRVRREIRADCLRNQSSALAEFASINFLIRLLCAIA